MWDKIKSWTKKQYFEDWVSLYFLIGATIILFIGDSRDILNSISFYASLILVFVLGGVSRLRKEISDLKESLTK